MLFCFLTARQAPSDETQNRAIRFCAALWRPAEGEFPLFVHKITNVFRDVRFSATDVNLDMRNKY